jgi:hypothetical protein
MSPSLARLLVRLHAPAWRQRYGEEFEALLIDTPLTVANLLNAGDSVADSRKLAIVIPFLAIAAVVAAAFMIPAHRSLLPSPTQLASTKAPADDLRLDPSFQHALPFAGDPRLRRFYDRFESSVGVPELWRGRLSRGRS